MSSPNTDNARQGLEAYGFTHDELYTFGLKFLKEKEGKAFHLTYADKLKLVAYTMQIKHGPYDPAHAPDTGLLDVVGRDRKSTWQKLKSISREEAVKGFLDLLDSLCPLFQHVLEALQRETEEKERLSGMSQSPVGREEEQRKERELEEQRKKAAASSSQLEKAQFAEAVHQAEHLRKTQHEAQIRSALNQQTIGQFRQYAEQQYPKDSAKQEELILQLQEQHFQQYMTQVYQQQINRQRQNCDESTTLVNGWNSSAPKDSDQHFQTRTVNGNAELSGAASAEPIEIGTAEMADQLILQNTERQSGFPLSLLAAPSMWTRRDIGEFKSGLLDDKDAMLKIGSGEVVTVRVPTHEEGSCLFWEFATDHYDIGFGVFFEWTASKSPVDSHHRRHPSEEGETRNGESRLPAVGDVITVHVAETISDEEHEDTCTDEGSPALASTLDPSTAPSPDTSAEGTPVGPLDEIVPVYRRDSHTEVYCGSHQYPGRGVYLLKFDNSYSLWRVKRLYYRVYYTK